MKGKIPVGRKRSGSQTRRPTGGKAAKMPRRILVDDPPPTPGSVNASDSEGKALGKRGTGTGGMTPNGVARPTRGRHW